MSMRHRLRQQSVPISTSGCNALIKKPPSLLTMTLRCVQGHRLSRGTCSAVEQMVVMLGSKVITSPGNQTGINGRLTALIENLSKCNRCSIRQILHCELQLLLVLAATCADIMLEEGLSTCSVHPWARLAKALSARQAHLRRILAPTLTPLAEETLVAFPTDAFRCRGSRAPITMNDGSDEEECSEDDSEDDSESEEGE